MTESEWCVLSALLVFRWRSLERSRKLLNRISQSVSTKISRFKWLSIQWEVQLKALTESTYRKLNATMVTVAKVLTTLIRLHGINAISFFFLSLQDVCIEMMAAGRPAGRHLVRGSIQTALSIFWSGSVTFAFCRHKYCNRSCNYWFIYC